MRIVAMGSDLKGKIQKAVWIVGLILLLTVEGGRQAAADIFMYIDSEGVLHFTNRPTSSKYEVFLKQRPRKPKPQLDSSAFDNLIQDASRRYGVSFSLIKAIIRAESGFNPKAVSHKGAKGLMQIMPQNFKLLNIRDPFNPKENIMAGVRYMALMLDRFQGKVPLALAAYNAGPNKVEAYQDIPPIQETEEYVKKVMTYYYAYN
jgi:soluble lytic murein transglycosylase-like protein